MCYHRPSLCSWLGSEKLKADFTSPAYGRGLLGVICGKNNSVIITGVPYSVHCTTEDTPQSLPHLLTHLKPNLARAIIPTREQTIRTHMPQLDTTHTHTTPHLYPTSRETYIAFDVLNNALKGVSLPRRHRPTGSHYASELPGTNMGQRLDATIPNFPNDGQDGMVSVRSLHCGHLICHGPGKRRRGGGGV